MDEVLEVFTGTWGELRETATGEPLWDESNYAMVNS